MTVILAVLFGTLACGGFHRGDDDNEIDTDLLCGVGCVETADSADTGEQPLGDGVWRPADDIDVDFNSDGVAFTVTDSRATSYYFGIAQTAAGGNGWYGEDCGENGFCHVMFPVEDELEYASGISQVEPGESTLFNPNNQAVDLDGLTFILQLDGGPHDGDCFVWGDDISYYRNDGCDSL